MKCFKAALLLLAAASTLITLVHGHKDEKDPDHKHEDHKHDDENPDHTHDEKNPDHTHGKFETNKISIFLAFF